MLGSAQSFWPETAQSNRNCVKKNEFRSGTQNSEEEKSTFKIFEHQPAPQRLPDVQFCGTLILPKEVYLCVSQYYITFA